MIPSQFLEGALVDPLEEFREKLFKLDLESTISREVQFP